MGIKKINACIFIIVLMLISACTTTKPVNPADPYEAYNRQMFTFNRTMDHTFFIPVAKSYRYFVMPQVRQGVTNFFSNFDTPTIVVDDLLQGDFINALGDSWRFIINSSFGILGIFNVASHMRIPIPYHYNDFGLTLARWGVQQSPYLVLPFLGPSTPRDAFGILVDYYAFSFYPYIHPYYDRWAILGVYYLNTRTNFLDYQHLLAAATLDPYVFQRNAFLQRRAYLIQQMQEHLYREYHRQNEKQGPFLVASHPWQHESKSQHA